MQALQEDLSSRQQQVSALQQISSQLLLEASGEDSMEAKEKVHVVSSKLHLMTLKVSAALRSLQSRLVGSDSLMYFIVHIKERGARWCSG